MIVRNYVERKRREMRASDTKLEPGAPWQN